MTSRWRSVAAATGLIAPDGATRPTIFAEMTALATSTGAANLGQGFPDADGPAWIREAAVRAIEGGANQYPPGRGIRELREAVAAHQSRHYGISLDPETEILITAGATEAIAAAVLALAGPDDEVVTLEPFYDAHAATIAMSGATHRRVPLRPTDTGFRVDLEALRDTVTERTRVILVNSPHNPTGTVLTEGELRAIADAARRVDAVVVTDEVYEHLTFDGREHTPIATRPGMAERTLTISSAGKTFSLTGWKVGWISGPARLIEAVLAIKQFLTYSGGAPFQPAIARALTEGDAKTAVGYLDTYGEDSMLTDKVLEKSNELAPIADVVVGESQETQSDVHQVEASFTLGGETVERTFEVWTIGETTIYDGVMNFSGASFDGLGLTINGVEVTADSVSLFPGAYELALDVEEFEVKDQTEPLILATQSDNEKVYELQPTLTEEATQTFRDLVTASLTECLAAKTLTTECGMDVSGFNQDGYSAIDGTVTRTLTAEGTSTLKNLTATPSYDVPTLVTSTDYIAVDMTLEAENSSGRAQFELLWGGDLGTPSVDFADENPTVTWD